MGFSDFLKEMGKSLMVGWDHDDWLKEIGPRIQMELGLTGRGLTGIIDGSFGQLARASNGDLVLQVPKSNIRKADEDIAKIPRMAYARATFGWAILRDIPHLLVVAIFASDYSHKTLVCLSELDSYTDNRRHYLGWTERVENEGGMTPGIVIAGNSEETGYRFAGMFIPGRSVVPIRRLLADGVLSSRCAERGWFIPTYEGRFIDPKGPSSEFGGWLTA